MASRHHHRWHRRWHRDLRHQHDTDGRKVSATGEDGSDPDRSPDYHIEGSAVIGDRNMSFGFDFVLDVQRLITCMQTVPDEWMPDAQMKGCIVHWTAGTNEASSTDLEHYHILIDGEGNLVRGEPTIDLNSMPEVQDGYAAHTKNCNTGMVGVSLCGMAGATESPYSSGDYPLTEIQWDVMIRVVADLAIRYDFPILLETVMTHAEVEDNLGIEQEGKWDITHLPFDPSIEGARAVGDRLRSEVLDRIEPPLFRYRQE